jgi:hypothetical protein
MDWFAQRKLFASQSEISRNHAWRGKQQQASIGRLVAALKISCEFLASNRWKVEGMRSSVGHGGCGVALVHDAIRLNIDLLRESRLSRYQPPTNSHPRA